MIKLENEEFLDGKTIENFWTIEFNHIKSVVDIDFNDNNIKIAIRQDKSLVFIHTLLTI